MEPLKLVNNTKEWLFLSLILIFIFSVNIYNEYRFFKIFTADEFYETNGKILNLYPKQGLNSNDNIVKIETDNFTFFTTISKTIHLKRTDEISFLIVTQKIEFIDFLKGGFIPTFGIEFKKSSQSLIDTYSKNITDQHTNESIGNLFSALFFATALDKSVQNLCSFYGISHIVAISGFHLGIISIVCYFILHLIYRPIHQIYFPYRNKKFDILIITSILLFIYLLAINLVPSFLRSFLMFIFGIFLLRSNIKLLSFTSLGIVVALIISFFPRLVFSISLWFSVAGVFYIFLYIHYFQKLNKYISFLFFNFWIFFAINPITHYFFGAVSVVQFLSPLITIGFVLFYPLELVLHLIGFGNLLDPLIEMWLHYPINHYNIFVSFEFLVYYICVSFLAIRYKYSFYLLNFSMFLGNIYIYSLLIDYV